VRIILAVIALAVVACSDDTKTAEDPIGESYHEALDKADEVEAIVEEQAEATRKKLEEAEGN
jgi:hypothetical protein